MPTRRTQTFIFLSLLLYLFANQTQLGWLYVTSAILAGIVVAAFFNNRRALKGLNGQRQIGKGDATELYEEDEITITLQIQNPQNNSAQIRAIETCPLIDPTSENHTLNLFIPSIKPGQILSLEYLTPIYKRGLHEFPPVIFKTGAPFGLFQQEKKLDISSRALVYPELRPLNRLELLDRQPSINLTRPRAGWGTEVIGIRPYRPGDSPRHIHWRSVARMGGYNTQLISKEFVDESQPGLTLALDLYPHPLPQTVSKHTSFEWMIKIAASIGDYAIRRGYALHLLTDETAWPAPRGPITRQALLEFLARVRPAGQYPLSHLLTTRNTQTFVAAILPFPDTDSIPPLLSLKQQGTEILVMLPDPATFPMPGASAGPLADELSALGLDTRLIQFGEDWIQQLATTPEFQSLIPNHL